MGRIQVKALAEVGRQARKVGFPLVNIRGDAAGNLGQRGGTERISLSPGRVEQLHTREGARRIQGEGLLVDDLRAGLPADRGQPVFGVGQRLPDEELGRRRRPAGGIDHGPGLAIDGIVAGDFPPIGHHRAHRRLRGQLGEPESRLGGIEITHGEARGGAPDHAMHAAIDPGGPLPVEPREPPVLRRRIVGRRRGQRRFHRRIVARREGNFVVGHPLARCGLGKDPFARGAEIRAPIRGVGRPGRQRSAPQRQRQQRQRHRCLEHGAGRRGVAEHLVVQRIFRHHRIDRHRRPPIRLGIVEEHVLARRRAQIQIVPQRIGPAAEHHRVLLVRIIAGQTRGILDIDTPLGLQTG